MAEKSTFVKLDRNILLWRWFGDDKTFKIFVYLILKANIKPHDFQGITIQRGQLFTSLPTIASETKSSVQSVRTALNHLKSTGNQQSTNRRSTVNQQQSKNNKKDTNVSKKEKKDAAPATPDGGGRAEWEIRQKVPDMFIGQFESEEAYLSLMSGEGYDPH